MSVMAADPIFDKTHSVHGRFSGLPLSAPPKACCVLSTEAPHIVQGVSRTLLTVRLWVLVAHFPCRSPTTSALRGWGGKGGPSERFGCVWMGIVSRPSMRGLVYPACSTKPANIAILRVSLPRVGPDLCSEGNAVEGIDGQETKRPAAHIVPCLLGEHLHTDGQK